MIRQCNSQISYEKGPENFGAFFIRVQQKASPFNLFHTKILEKKTIDIGGFFDLL